MRYPNTEDFYRKVGKRIRQLRQERDWSQTELGFQSELDKSVIQRIERGSDNSTLKTLLKIANALDVEFKELFDRL